MRRLSVIVEANRVSELLEAAARGLHRRRHKKHVAAAKGKIEGVLAGYFKRQAVAVIDEIKPRIKPELSAHTTTEALAQLTFAATLNDDHGVFVKAREASSDGKGFARKVLPSSVAPLRFAITSAEDTEYQAAIRDAIAGAAATLTKEAGRGAIETEDIASRYLRENSLTKLTGGFSETSVDRLRGAIAEAWDKGGSYDQIVAAVQDTFENFSDVRAGLIAQTEAVSAYSAGREAVARAAGLDEKSWETESGDPCPVCIDNEADGWIDIDENFSSGDDAPTAHPNCQCVLNFRTGTEDE